MGKSLPIRKKKKKGEITRNEQFLFFSQCFHKLQWFIIRITSMKNPRLLFYKSTRFHCLSLNTAITVFRYIYILNKSENAIPLLLVKIAENHFLSQFLFCKTQCLLSSYHLRCTFVLSK